MKARFVGVSVVTWLETYAACLLAACPRRLARAAASGVLVGAWQGGCYSQSVCEYPTGPCVETGGPVEAVVTAAAAGAIWVAADGCAVAGCRPPLVCNTSSGFCNYARCDEGSGPCPPGTRCNATTHTCR